MRAAENCTRTDASLGTEGSCAIVISLGAIAAAMVKKRLSKKEIDSVKAHVNDHPMTLALIRTEHAPSELDFLFKGLEKACGVELVRRSWSPSSDFGFAELNSNSKMLVVLWVGGNKTELVAVSEIDRATLLDMEQEVFSSNIHSTSIKDGL